MSKRFILAAAIVLLVLAGLAGCTKPEEVTVDITLTEAVDSYDIPYAKFVFNFNQDVTVDSIYVTIPDTVVSTPYKVPNIAGDYEGDTDNEFHVYWKDNDGNDVVMKGTYTVELWGIRAKDEESFDLTKTLSL
jgi:uncharacterized protein YcfL